MNEVFNVEWSNSRSRQSKITKTVFIPWVWKRGTAGAAKLSISLNKILNSFSFEIGVTFPQKNFGISNGTFLKNIFFLIFFFLWVLAVYGLPDSSGHLLKFQWSLWGSACRSRVQELGICWNVITGEILSSEIDTDVFPYPYFQCVLLFTNIWPWKPHYGALFSQGGAVRDLSYYW